MAAGVFPVVSDCPANREWISGDGDGLLFPPDDVAALTAALERAITAPAAWDTARERNRMLVRARADRDTNLDVLGTHYERLVDGAGRRRRGVPVPSGATPSLARVGGTG